MIYHSKYGELTPAEKKYNPIGNKVEQLYVDKFGEKHTLDGTEKESEDIEKQETETIEKGQDNLKKQKLKELEEEMDFENNLAGYDEKEAEKEEKGRRHTEVVKEVKNASTGIVEAIKAIPETVIPEVKIPDHYKEEQVWQKKVLEVLKKEINLPETNFDPVVKAVEKIKFPNFPEAKDYTKLFQDIKNALPKDTDLSGVIQAIKEIPQVKIPDFEFRNGRLKVEIDRTASGGGGGGLGTADSAKLKTLAIEAKQDDIIANQLSQLMVRIATNSADDSITYVGRAPLGSATSASVWQIVRYSDAETEVSKFANSGAYDQVFDDRESLSFS